MIEDTQGICSFSSSLSEITVEWDETLSEIEYESAVADLRAALDRVDDVTGDGVPDVVAGSFDSYVGIFDGKDGTVVWSFDTGEAKVMTVRGTPDMTGDCVPDVIAGTQDSGDGGGTTFLLNGCP